MQNVFKHSGDLGDIIYSLPTIKALGGGVLYLDVTGGTLDPLMAKYAFEGQTSLNPASFDVLKPLLVHQPYIEDVRVWKGETITHNLDEFRRLARADFKTNLAVLHLRTFGLDERLYNEPWLELRENCERLDKPVVVNRTVRYQSKYHWWLVNKQKFLHRAIFIGHEKEHEVFEYTFRCCIERRDMNDALDIAKALCGAEVLVANQSFVMSLAIGLGVPYYQEVYDFSPNCIFERENGKYF
jgi:hypothetical protein